MDASVRNTLLSLELDYPIERKEDLFYELFDDADSMQQVIIWCREYKEEMENYRHWEPGFCQDIWIKDPTFYIDYFFERLPDPPREDIGRTILWIGLEMFAEDIINDLYKELVKWEKSNETNL